MTGARWMLTVSVRVQDQAQVLAQAQVPPLALVQVQFRGQALDQAQVQIQALVQNQSQTQL